MNNYESTAEIYDILFPVHYEELSFYSKYIKKNYSVLEVGCGTGNVIIQLLIDSKAQKFSCVDISKSMLDVLRIKYSEAIEMGKIRKGRTLNIYESDMQYFTSEEKFDIILFPGESIQTLPKIKIEETINKYIDLLSNNGRLILTSFNPNITINKDCKEILYALAQHQNCFYFSFKEILLITNDDHKYKMKVKKYDKFGNLIQIYEDDFNISVLDNVFWKNIIDNNRLNIDKWRTGFKNNDKPDESSSVLVIKKSS